MSVIELNNVSFAYSVAGVVGPRALDSISLSINEGDFVGVIGPSGAGKSTLTSVMSGAIPHHYSGELYGATLVDGKDTCEVTLTDISRIVGSVLQDIDTQMVASVVEDEMLYGLENFGVDHAQIEQRIAEALETVGITDLREREIATLSGGQKQKVAIAAILALKPRVLVLDEPTAALDPASSELVFDTLRTINQEQNVTVVVVEQKIGLLSCYCNRLVVLNEGKLAFEGTPREVFDHGKELRAMGVDSPRVARISNSLVEKGVVEPILPCINVDETVQLIKSLVGNKAAGANMVQPSQSPHVPARPKAEGATPAVTFRDVSFAYPNGGASVDNLDITVYPGELVGIVGQNGAGKTTLTKLLNGLLKPSSGDVEVAGLNTKTTPTSQIAAHCATLFQNPDRQLCKDTVLEEIAFGLELTGHTTEDAQARAKVVAERFGLPLDEAPFSLSRGQRQMVALASVVVLEPEVIVFDEPTSGLDYRECMTVMKAVSEMAEQGSAVVMVCHDMEVVSDFAERLVVMANGRILGKGESREIFNNAELMEAAYVAPPQVIELSARLAQEVSPVYANMSEVSNIVDVTEELVNNG